jgi:hypothetical protein
MAAISMAAIFGIKRTPKSPLTCEPDPGNAGVGIAHSKEQHS